MQINLGSAVNDGTGNPLRTGGLVINQYGILNDKTINAAFYKTSSNTNEAAITLAIVAAALLGSGAAVWVPQSMLPYNASLVTFNAAVRMIREGGNPSVYDVCAYGAAGDNSHDDTANIQAVLNLLSSGTDLDNFEMYMPGTSSIGTGDYKITTTLITPQSASRFMWRGSGFRASRLVWAGAAGIPMIELRNPRWVTLEAFAIHNPTANNPSDGVLVHRMAGQVGAPAATSCYFNHLYIGGDTSSPTYSIVNGLHFRNDSALLNNDESHIGDCFITNCSGRGIWFDGLDSRQHMISGGDVGPAGIAAISNVMADGSEGGSFVCVGTNVTSQISTGTCFELGICENPCVVIGAKSEGPGAYIKTPTQLITKESSFHFLGCYYSGSDGTLIQFDAVLGHLKMENCFLVTPATANYSFPTAGSSVDFDNCDMNISTMTFANDVSLVKCVGRTGSSTFTNSGSTGYLRIRDSKSNLVQYNTAGNAGDRGDASVTLQAGKDNEVQMWNTPLTADRTVTLSTTNARKGDKFRIVRMAGATGSSFLIVSNVQLQVGQFSEWTYDAGFGGWQKTAGGPMLLPQLGLALAEATLVSGVDATGKSGFEVTLTAARLVGAPTNMYLGQPLTFTFIQGGAGAFAVTWNAVFKKIWSDVGNATGTRSSITFAYDGTNWNQISGQALYV